MTVRDIIQSHDHRFPTSFASLKPVRQYIHSSDIEVRSLRSDSFRLARLRAKSIYARQEPQRVLEVITIYGHYEPDINLRTHVSEFIASRAYIAEARDFSEGLFAIAPSSETQGVWLGPF